MEDEDLAVPGDEEAEDVEAEEEPEKAASEAEDEDAEAEDEEEIETISFDFGGNTLEIPKDQIPEELAERVGQFTKNTWAEVTRRNQEIAETRKGLEQRQQFIERLEGLKGAALDSFSRGRALQNQISELEQINLRDLRESDPDRAREISDDLSQARTDLQRIIAETQQHESEAQKAQDAEMARLADEGKKKVSAVIPDFDADRVVDYVVSAYGYPREVAERWPLDPAAAQMAYKAMRFDEAQARAKLKKAKPKPAAAVKPIRGRGGRSSTALSDDLSVEEWQRRRNLELAEKRKSR